jgi:hypothetical protein
MAVIISKKTDTRLMLNRIIKRDEQCNGEAIVVEGMRERIISLKTLKNSYRLIVDEQHISITNKVIDKLIEKQNSKK